MSLFNAGFGNGDGNKTLHILAEEDMHLTDKGVRTVLDLNRKNSEIEDDIWSSLIIGQANLLGYESLKGKTVDDINNDPGLKEQVDIFGSILPMDVKVEMVTKVNDIMLKYSDKLPDDFMEKNSFAVFEENANKLKSAVKDQYKDVTIDIVPQSNKEVFDSIIGSVKPGDDISIMGHSGSRLMGIPTSYIFRHLPDSTDCYLGSCGGQAIIDKNKNELKDKKDISVFSMPIARPWFGPNKTADNIVDAMFSISIDDKKENGFFSNTPPIIKDSIVEGRDYIKQDF